MKTLPKDLISEDNDKLMKNKSINAYFGSIEDILGSRVTVHNSFVRSKTLS